MSFVPLKSLLPQTAHEPASKEPVKPTAFFDILKRILLNELGPVVALKIHPLFVKNQVAFVVCFHRASADILRLKEKEILANVNEQLDKTTIDKLYCLG